MPSKEKKPKASDRKPFKVLTRKAVIGWLVAVFIACGWMFALGVLVGRNQAPIKYDIDAIGKKLSELKQRESVKGDGGMREKKAAPKDRNQLEFYEALPENREDTKLLERPMPKAEPDKSSAIAKKVEPSRADSVAQQTAKKSASPPSGDAPSQPKAAASSPGIFTIQASSVKNKPDADRLVGKLKERGFPAYLLTSELEGKGTWHRVRIGSYPTREEAARVLDELRRAGMKPILVKTK